MRLIMTLSHYLSDYFYTKAQLCQYTQISEQALDDMIENGLMPNAAYSITNHLECCSYYGIEQVTEQLDYYPRGYDKWLKMIMPHLPISPAQAFNHFQTEFCQHLNQLQLLGLSLDMDFLDDLTERLPDHWAGFLSGKYGVMTANGLIREIVELECACYVVNTTSEIENNHDEQQLRLCEKLLNRSLSMGCEHEQNHSLRKKMLAIINQRLDHAVYV